MRLNKDCTYEVIAKKPGPGPKSRSRVRQLEQRVESLIDLLHAKNTDVGPTKKTTPASQIVTPESSTQTDTAPHPSPRADLHRLWIEAANFRALDPVDAGLIDEQHSYRLVRKFQESFIWSFPFVVVDTDGPTLRRQEPFLFHAILTVTAVDTPSIQHGLSERFRHEIGRMVEYGRKSLGILQGLLVYGGWYHGFYHPASQQLSTVVQLCVAMVQDLGLSSPVKRRPGKLWSAAECTIFNRAKGSLVEKRAFLGTYFLTAVFNHAWRKTTTLSYTRFLSQCCAAFQGSSVPSDILINPLIKANELLSRVNEHFSYFDIDNAEIRGDIILEMSTSSFLAELDRIRESIAFDQTLKSNTTLKLLIALVDVGIHEICLHSSLWNPLPRPATNSQSIARLKMLHRTMEAVTLYMKTLLNVSKSQLYKLGLGTWSAWFYAYVVICKLVFLEENERLGNTNVDDIPEEINNLLPNPLAPENAVSEDTHDPKHVCQPADCSNPGWNALAVTHQYGLREISEQFTEKFQHTLSADDAPWIKPREDRDSLYTIACLHHVMFHGYKKRLQRHQLAMGLPADRSNVSSSAAMPMANPQDHHSIDQWQSSQIIPSESNIEPVGGTGVLPFASFMNFDSINFDGFTMPASALPMQAGEDMFGDWMWNMAMDDFTMPTL